MRFCISLRRLYWGWRLLIAGCIVLFSLGAHADAVVNPTALTQTHLKTVRNGLFQRDILFIEPAPADDGPYPVVVLLSYLGGSPGPMANLVGAGELVRDQHYIVVVPQSVSGIWNYNPLTKIINDVDFLDQVIDITLSSTSADPDRVYMAGYSNGGLMTYAYACQRAHRLAAAATISSNLRTGIKRRCSPDAPLPFIQFNGDADQLVPYDGNLITVSSRNTARFWAKANGCATTPSHSSLPDDVNDGTTASLMTFSGCRDDATVRLFTIHGGGHTWPGRPEVQPALGRTGQDIDATQRLGHLFSEYSRP